MSTELLVILLGAFVVALAWFLLKFGKVSARAALVAGVLALAIILALGILQNAVTARKAVTVATVTGAGAAGASGVAMLLGGMLVAALGAVGYLVIRLRAAEGRPLLPQRKRREKRRRLPSESAPIVYEESDGLGLADLDLSDWGW
jgi:hypothetical protein